jgi:hypothetical protein
MPYTGYIKSRGREYSAKAVSGKAMWIAVPYGFSDGTHVDFKPQLLVEVEYLKNFNTPPKKWGKPTAKTWTHRVWVTPGMCFEMNIDKAGAGPKPHGKGWKRGLDEAYPR